MEFKKGFTLIELLVVIAIIGILSGLIIVSMGSANNSAKNARIQADLDQLRVTAQLFYNSSSTYSGYSAASTSASILISDAIANGVASQPTIPTATATSWCAIVSIWGATATSWSYWCVDVLGNANVVLTASGSQPAAYCAGTNFTCR